MALLCSGLLAGTGCTLDGQPQSVVSATPSARTATNLSLTPTTAIATTSAPTDVGSPPPTVTSGATAFAASVSKIGPKLRARMRFTHHPGCPVRLRDLRYLQVSFLGFAGATHTGELVVHESQARQVVRVFGSLYDARFPIRRMKLVDAYQGDDDASMSANNTSAYNCRRTTGGDRWSEHAYGRAIDVNPVQNPYVNDSFVTPQEGQQFAGIDRSTDAPYVRGALRSADVVVTAFARVGWLWGGDWVHSKDYQHFSTTGR